jgi:hypothetical protein
VQHWMSSARSALSGLSPLSGLSGLARVRRFVQDDCRNLAREDQLRSEMERCLKGIRRPRRRRQRQLGVQFAGAAAAALDQGVVGPGRQNEE